MTEPMTIIAFVQLDDTLVEKEMEIKIPDSEGLGTDFIDEEVGNWVLDRIKWGWNHAT